MTHETLIGVDGPSEADTSYIGGKAANMHAGRRARVIRGRGTSGKTAIHGILERGETSQVRTEVISNEDSGTLVPLVRRHVRYGGTVYTDAAHAYGELALTHWHKSIDHTKRYVEGEIHTNGLENFWSLFKRCLGGTYVSVAPFHLFRYAAEQVYRFNFRVTSDWHRFEQVLRRIGGKRLTFRVLTGKDDAGFMGLR